MKKALFICDEDGGALHDYVEALREGVIILQQLALQF